MPGTQGDQASINPFEPASRTENTSASVIDVATLRKQRTTTRRKITATCNQISRTVLERGSRGGIRALIQTAKAALAQAEHFGDLLVDEDDADRQYENHLRYVELVGKVSEEVEFYLVEREDDPASVVGQPIGGSAPAAMQLERGQPLPTDPPNGGPTGNDRGRDRPPVGLGPPPAIDEEVDEVERLLRGQLLDGGGGPNPGPGGRAARWCQEQRQLHSQTHPTDSSIQESAPDDWIDLYYAGRLLPAAWNDHGSRSSVKADLEVFTGRSLDWFGWIDLFRALVHDTGKSPGEKLAILRRSLRGDCSNVVYGLGGGEEAYGEALRRLKEAYGRRDVMRAAHLQEIERLEVGRNDPSAFKRFAERIRTHLFDLSRIGERTSVDIIERICLKLNPPDRLAWNAERTLGLETRTLNEFGAWLCSRAAAYQNAYIIATDQNNPSQFHQRGHHARANKSSSQQQPEQKQPTTKSPNPFCFKCERNHRLEDCSQFKELSVKDRVTFCLRHKLCYSCFGTRHSARDCQQKKPCQHTDCKSFHHRLLHGEPPPNAARNNVARQEDSVNAHNNTTRGSVCTVALGVIRLEARGPDGQTALVNVMFDEGSDTTLVREGLAQHLKLEGRVLPLNVDGVGGAKVQFSSRRVQIQLEGAEGESIWIAGSTLPTVTSPVRRTDWSQIKRRWAHLSDLPLRSTGGRIDILLGLDQAYLMTALEVRAGGDEEPVAYRTRLGWMVRGIIEPGTEVIKARTHVVFRAEEIDPLTTAIRRFCDTEDFGTEYQAGCLSAEDRRAIEILQSGIRQLEVGYEAPITWKEGEPELRSNRLFAERRLDSLLRRFASAEKFENDYRAAMEKNFTQGYAVVIDDDPAERQDEYLLSHHGVQQGSKVRVVFDAAARFRGKSLNESIISGPTLLTPLQAVFIRFQEGAIAWAADVEAMFSRIRLRQSDARYFRFLWKRKGEEKTLLCEMRRLPFGATCSPFIAISVLRRTAADLGAEDPVKYAIENKFYVDDYLGSAKSVQLGAGEAVGVKKTLERGDFHLQGWISNSSEFMEAIGMPPGNPADGVSLSLDGGDAEKVLGIMWNPTTDCIGFKVASVDDVKYTRVGLLSKVKSLFDPQGWAGPLTVKAKIQIRLLGVKGLQLNDPVVGEDRSWWEQWFQSLEKLNNIQLPRCLFPDEDNIVQTELHTFGDASKEAFAAVIYLRQAYQDGRVSLHLVKAATKIAPKRAISIPRMELNASLLAARLARTVQQALTRKIHRRYLWTDSSTVRNWIRAPASSYHVFVANRIGEIQTLTEPEEWRFVPGKLNPADAATRSAFGEEVIPAVWMTGPDFLRQPESQWPKDVPWMTVTEELLPVRTYHVSGEAVDWEKVDFKRTDLPELARMDGSVRELIRRCQQEVYQADIRRLKKRKDLEKTSSLLALAPFLGRDGLVRLGHRGRKAKLPHDRFHPSLLPGKHPLTRKIIAALHLELKHVGTDFLLSHLQQYVWVTGGREAVKRVRRECLICRRERAKPGVQQMGDLPESRLQFGTKPFTFTACDLFGPIEVALPRNRSAKRWGVLFTCLVTRAVFLDLVPSLSADDYLLALRRFIGTYGRPKKMHSDNGTNFVGAERELREAAEKLHGSDQLPPFFRDKGIEWTFQPARTPHFGGAHESMVRSTKKALYRALEEEAEKMRYPPEDVLRTILFEVAGLLNSRPLTYVSSDPEDYRSLTPNDFMNRPQPADVPHGPFEDALPREHYRYSQKIIKLFWDQWKTVYLQSLASRRKWQMRERNFAVGDIVQELDRSLPRGQWSIGHVAKVYPGEDGLVRVVDVQLPTGIYRRGINRISLLEPISAAGPMAAPPASGEHVPATDF